MAVTAEEHAKPTLVTSRTPVGPNNASTNTPGDTALRDALMVVVAAWLVLFILYWTLRNHNA